MVWYRSFTESAGAIGSAAQLEVIERCGHLRPIECPEAFADAVIRFLAVHAFARSMEQKGIGGHVLVLEPGESWHYAMP